MIHAPDPAMAESRQAAKVAPPSAGEPAAVESASLLQGGKLALIRHNDLVYRLQVTRAGKLILTK